jgi:hypothetical protein
MEGPDSGASFPVPEEGCEVKFNSPSMHVAETEYTGRYPSLETKKDDESGSRSSEGPAIVTVNLGQSVIIEMKAARMANPLEMTLTNQVNSLPHTGTDTSFCGLCHACGEPVTARILPRALMIKIVWERP